VNGEQLYFTISQMTLQDKKIYLATLTEQQRTLYKKYGNKMRQQRYNEKPENKEKLNEHRRQYIAKQREEKPEEFKKQNIKDVKAFREREKLKLEEIETKLKQQEQEELREIVYDIIDTIPKQADLKKKREYMREYRQKKKKTEGK
jgi:hypothetical protein